MSSASVPRLLDSKPISLLNKPKPRWQTALLSALFLMTKTKAKKAIRIGNRLGKTMMGDVADSCCEALPTPRRSILVAEANSIIDREVARVKSELTIFDDRLAIIRQVEETESELEYLNTRTHDAQIRNKQLRSDLSRINLAIKRQMELDGE